MKKLLKIFQIALLSSILFLLTPTSFAQDLVQFDFKTKPAQQDTCITNSASLTDKDNNQLGSSSVTTPVGNAQCTATGKSCYVYDTTWTDAEKATEDAAINFIAQSPAFMNLVCKGGNVTLTRIGGSVNHADCSKNIIAIANGGLGSLKQTAFTLGHESTHIFSACGQQIYRDFLNADPFDKEGYICSYPYDQIYGGKKIPGEDIAETSGIYIAWQNFPTDLCGVINMPFKYPLHYQWAKDHMFGGFEYYNY